MRKTIMMVLFAILATPCYAQTISIYNSTTDLDSSVVESALKQLLREEGFTVKSGTSDGYLVMLSSMSLHNKGGYKTGIVTHISVGSVQWQSYADAYISETCKKDHERVQMLKDLIGIRIIHIDDTMFVGATASEITGPLSLFVTRTVRDSAQKVTKFLDAIERKSKERSQTIKPVF